MSGYISGAIWQSGPDVQSRRLVLLAIADNADDYGYAFPSVETLAKKCLMSERNVLRCLADLEKSGWILIDRKAIGSKGNAYQIVLDMLAFRRPKSGDMVSCDKKSGDTTGKSQVTPRAESGDKSDIAIRKNCQELSLEPSLFKLQEPEFPTWFPVDEWQAYLGMRKKLRKPATEHAQELLRKKLSKFHDEGLDITAVLQQSIVSSYTDLYPPKNNGKGNGNGKTDIAQALRDTVHRMYAEDDRSVPD